ncbi:cupin domain-containing protein [Rhodopila sp.]|uniref:cupin domain-containing protein n=1 Tax=Rhodopila sp. TaxID=2480087 RepID=UPI003D100EC2
MITDLEGFASRDHGLAMDSEQQPTFRPSRDGFRWDGVAHQPYKQDGGAPFKDVSRQVLFHEDGLACELRYFEVDGGGYSTLERHQHAHAVMVIRGHGECLVGGEIRSVKPLDLVSIASWTWHQFRASEHEPLGFLCMVNIARDRPQLPTEQEMAQLKALPGVGRFLEKHERKARRSALSV